jgi:hypothetical protein
MSEDVKYDPADDSKVEGAIGVVKGRVEIHYPQPRLRVVFDPENARIFGEMMAKASYEARYGVKPAEGTSRIGEDVRTRLVNRVAIVAGSMAREYKSNQEIATAVVDVVLKEVA